MHKSDVSYQVDISWAINLRISDNRCREQQAMSLQKDCKYAPTLAQQLVRWLGIQSPG